MREEGEIVEQAQESAIGVESKITSISEYQGWCHGERFLLSWHIV